MDFMVEESVPKKRRGRKGGEFELHKHKLYEYLRDKHPKGYGGTNEDLSVVAHDIFDIWGRHFRIGVTSRQVARYLRSLETEGVINIKTARHRMGDNQWCNRRIITVVGV